MLRIALCLWELVEELNGHEIPLQSVWDQRVKQQSEYGGATRPY